MPSASHAEQVLEGLPQRLMVVLPDRQLVFANASAERMFRDGQARTVAGRLMSVGQLNAGKIEEMLHQCVGGAPSPVGLWFSPSLRTGWLELSTIGTNLARGADWPADSLLAQIQLDEPALTQSARIDALFHQCQLTTTERYVLMLLADGLTVDAAASHLGLQVCTLRSHVRSLLTKCQAPTLMQLVRWLGSTTWIAQPVIKSKLAA
jgi:DNA-binding CsgD family transcriptional regulator